MSAIIKYSLLVSFFIFSACALIFEDDIFDESVAVIMPVDNAMLSDSITLFWWEPVIGALDYSFQLIEGSFSSPQNLITDTLVTIEKLQLELKSGNYQWRISANGANGSTKFQLYSLEIIIDEDDFSDEIIDIIMPVDNAILTDSISLFWWEPVVGAMDYSFQLIEGSFDKPKNLVIDTLVTTEKLQIKLQTSNYQWRIKANGKNGSTQYQLYSLEIKVDEE